MLIWLPCSPRWITRQRSLSHVFTIITCRYRSYYRPKYKILTLQPKSYTVDISFEDCLLSAKLVGYLGLTWLTCRSFFGQSELGPRSNV